MALSLTANQRQALRDWVDANLHKVTYQDSWTEYQRDPETGEFVLVDSGQVDGEGNPIMERVVVQVHTVTYLATTELCYRLLRKINKHFPEKTAGVDLKDLEALVDDKLPQLLALAGADSVGCSPLNYSDYIDEDPDLA